jgi:hypothetical protein
MDTGHAILAPSSAHLRAACPGSRKLCALNPETEPSQDSLDGTAAHWAAQELFYGRAIDEGLIAPNGVMLTEEMVDAAQMFYDDVAATLARYPGARLHVEERVSIASIHAECWGTPDLWAYVPGTLLVWDFKYGHRFVEVYENEQLLEYVAGILDSLQINGLLDQQTRVIMRIVQPRCYVGGAPVREWAVTASELRPHFNQLRASEAAAMQDDAPTVVNQHCRDCRGRHQCEALQRAGYAGMDEARSNVPFDLPPAALGVELQYLDRTLKALEARRTGLAEQALAIIKRGQAVPFYSIEQSTGRERWTLPDAEVITMGDLMGVSLSKPKLITPKQAVKAGMDEATVKALSETPRGELKLVYDDGSKARRIFGVSS